MERILRSQEMAEIVLLPVRHHSPACAWHVSRMIEKLRPAAILVEGPDNANPLIPVMVHEETRPPFAIYYSYHDAAGRISAEKERYKCYYPFLDYSPELAALRAGERLGIPAAFIDLPYSDILAASESDRGLLKKEEEKSNYNDDYLLSRNAYLQQLCEKTGLRSFDEFWEKYFELNGIRQESEKWFGDLLTYCALARENTPREAMEADGCLARERFMAERIREWAEKSASGEKAVLAVTGGFHTPGLKELLEAPPEDARVGKTDRNRKRKTSDYTETKGDAYLMPYSMEAADALNGYASGMPFSGFYQRVWEELQETETPYENVVLDMIVSAGKETRRKEEYLSTYDEICACAMARGLADLRGKSQPGAYELLDAVMSSFIKGEYNLASDTPMRILRKHMTGKAVGELCRQADVPPIIHDFEEQCRKFGFKLGSTLETEVILSIFSNPKHRTASMFLNRMLYLGADFARRVKGPNLQLKKDQNLMREIWKYKWSARVNAALIDRSVYGAAVEEAAAGVVKEELKKELGAGAGAILLTRVFEMGLEGQLQPVYDRVHELTLKDADFYSIAEALKSLLMMEELGGLYGSRMEFGILIQIACRRLITLLPAMTRIKDEDLPRCMDALKLLYQVTGRKRGGGQEKPQRASGSGRQGDSRGTSGNGGQGDSQGMSGSGEQESQREASGNEGQENGHGQERESYFEALERMEADGEIHAGLNGCIQGIFYGSGRKSAEEVEMVCRGYLTGTKEQLSRTAQFFRGLFFTARDLVFIGDRFVRMLDVFYGSVSEKEFMELLPELRMAFAYFTPREIDKIAKAAAGLHGESAEAVLEGEEILPEWYSYGKSMDEFIRWKTSGQALSAGQTISKVQAIFAEKEVYSG